MSTSENPLDSHQFESKIQKTKTLPRLRLVAVLEGISYIVLLFIAMPMKYIYKDPWLVQKVGMLHGYLTVLFVLLLALAHYQYKWTWTKTLLALGLSFLPFGTFYAERKMFRE